MIAAIMQPYFFPYVGYFQLMKAADIFVIYDDAQYMKGGWINRNRVLIDGAPAWITLPLRRASHKQPINNRHYLFDNQHVSLIKNRLHASCIDVAPDTEAFNLVEDILSYRETNVALFNEYALKALAERLGITCTFIRSSDIDKPPNLHGEERVIDLCQRINATQYVNPIGGMALYDSKRFDKNGLRITFLQTTAPPTIARTGPLHLSIANTLVRRGIAACSSELPRYQILDSDGIPATNIMAIS